MTLLTNPPADAFLAAVQALPPPGPAFSRDADTVQAQVFTPPANALANVREVALLLANVESNPAMAEQLLSDFEADYGLPDPCSAPNPTLAQRRASLLAKIASIGGQSRDYFIGVAAALGFTVTITEYQPFRVGSSHLGDLVGGPGWESVWQINAPATTISYFRVGSSALGDRLATFGNAELECRMNALKPAQTLLLFNYS
jgi:uncharacterized protein YmfQ (DUF2313 family)